MIAASMIEPSWWAVPISGLVSVAASLWIIKKYGRSSPRRAPGIDEVHGLTPGTNPIQPPSAGTQLGLDRRPPSEDLVRPRREELVRYKVHLYSGTTITVEGHDIRATNAVYPTIVVMEPTYDYAVFVSSSNEVRFITLASAVVYEPPASPQVETPARRIRGIIDTVEDATRYAEPATMSMGENPPPGGMFAQGQGPSGGSQ